MVWNMGGGSYTHMPATYAVPEAVFYVLNLPVGLVVSFGFRDFAGTGASVWQ